jgi:hypothetical protein
MSQTTPEPGLIARSIFVLRGQKVLLDADLAALYGVATRTLVQAVKRNEDRFPTDFMFRLGSAEWLDLRSHSVTSNPVRGGRRYAPYAFTEQGVAMLASVLKSPQAIAVNIEIVRAFVRLREAIVSNKELTLRLDDLEKKAELISLKHDKLEHSTRVQLKQILAALRELMAPSQIPPKRPIGFVTPEDGTSKPNAHETNKRTSAD